MKKRFIGFVMCLCICLNGKMIGTPFSICSYASQQETIGCDDTTCWKVKITVPDSITLYEEKTENIHITTDKAVEYEVKYVSSDKKVVSVSKKGKVTGKKKGSATITTTVSGSHLRDALVFKTQVTVKEPSITIVAPKNSVKVGKKIAFTAKKEGVTGKVKWSVNNKKIASINGKGKLKGKKAGKVKVTATCGKVKKSITITVKG